MQKLIIILLLTFSSITSASEINYETSTSYMLELCNSDTELDKARCEAYIAGARAGATGQRLFIENQMRTMKLEEHAKKMGWLIAYEPFCIGNESNLQHLIESFKEFGVFIQKENPGFMESQAATTLLLALHRDFPCPEYN